MRAIVLDRDCVAVRSDHPEPALRDGEVMVDVLCAGICETDLQLMRGYMGFNGVLGHEFVGVARTGPLAGRRIVGEINCSCHRCETCLAGRPTHCPHRSVLGILGHDGAFADAIAVPQQNLHAVPESIPTDIAVFAEPVAAAFQITEQLSIGRQDRVVVLGDGRLGNLCAQVLARVSDHVAVVGKHPTKLALLESLGLSTSLLSDVLADNSANRAADIVVDCTGSPTGLPAALKMVRPRGTVVLKTTVAGDHATSLAPIVIDEVRVIGSRCGPFPKAIDALANGRIDVRPLIGAEFALDDAETAFRAAGEKGARKVLIHVDRD
jgi:threonine dehydrogenase-like Zn-dependent dehydrogenase